MENTEFELKLRISPSDLAFKKLVGVEKYEKIKIKTVNACNSSCKGCGYKPLDDSRALQILGLHVIELNEENPEQSICTALCKACHDTQHIDVSVDKGWVKLVNSTYSQKSLIEMCRINSFGNLNEDNLRNLKTTGRDFVEKMKAGNISENSKAKVLFTSVFEWDDM